MPRSTLSALVPIALFAGGCAGGTDDDRDGAKGGSETGDGTDGAGQGGTDCGDYSGFLRVGTTWTYEIDGSPTPYPIRLTALEADSVERVASVEIDAGGIQTEMTVTETDHCIDGAWYQDGAESITSTTRDGETTERTSSITYDGGCMVLPATLEVGQTWTVNCSLTSVDDSGTQTAEAEMQYEVLAEESVAVEAGTYMAMAVSQSADSQEITMWFAEDVGLLQSDELTLTAFSP